MFVVSSGLVPGAASLRAAGRSNRRYLPVLPVAFACLHLSYGLGFLVGLARAAALQGTLKVSYFRASLTGIYRDLLTALGHEPVFGKPKAVARIRSAFHEQIHTKHRLPFIILDEAHLFPVTVFEPLRLLFSTDMDSQSLGVLLLVGQPELRRFLKLTPHEAFYQRISTHFHLPSLDLAQTIAYVRHHVQLADYKAGPLFTDDALARIYENTKGVPRLINRLCTTALLVAASEKRQVVEESTIRKAIADLDQNG